MCLAVILTIYLQYSGPRKYRRQNLTMHKIFEQISNKIKNKKTLLENI